MRFGRNLVVMQKPYFQACIADKKKKISRLKEFLEAEKKKADKD